MDPAFALTLDNFIATPQGPTLRNGFRNQVTGFTTPVTSFISYNARNSSQNKLFAVSGGAIYDVSNPGAVGAPVQSGLSTSNVYWQSVQQTATNSATNYTIAVNGVDAPRIYNGTFTTCTQVTTPSTPGQFSTVDNNGNTVNISGFNDVTLHQERVWFVSNGSTIAYYCNIAQISGNLFAFDFGPFFARGGNLIKLSSWTSDTGGTSGIQVMLVAVSSEGDVVVFQGNDPATNFQLTSTYSLGAPIGKRCLTQFEGDLMYLSTDGLYLMSSYVQSARVDSTQSLSYYISTTLSALVSEFQTTPGFEMVVFYGQNLMLVNIPGPTPTTGVQYAFNTITKGWSRITGWPVQTWVIFNGNLFFGTPTSVAQGFIGFKDNANADGTGGSNIAASALTAFTAFPDTIGDGLTKTVVSVKPYITTSSSNPRVSVGVNTDFDVTPLLSIVSPTPLTGSNWDQVDWDAPNAMWGGTGFVFNQWFSPQAPPGNNLAFAISVSGVASLQWTKTQWRIIPGYEY
jgi:hypothetical protein